MTDTLTLPSRREEAWRWSDLSALPALAAATPSRARADGADLWIGCGGPRLLFVDGVLDAAASDLGPLAIGPVEAATDHALGRLALDRDGWSLAIDAGQAPPATIEIVHIATGGANHLPARVTLAEGAQGSIVETFAGTGWSNRLTAITLAPSARLMRSVRLRQDGGFVSLRDEADIAAGASLITILAGLGGADSRLDAAVTLSGEGAFAEHGGTLLARSQQRHDAAVVLRHAAPGGSSRQMWRAVADDQATVSIAARVEVARDAQKTDGEQSLRGLLLKRAATVNLKPELEIFADDVKCAHGASVGELDRQALFYLQSRGVPAPQARAILTRAFVAEAVERIGEDAVRDAFAQDVEGWLA